LTTDHDFEYDAGYGADGSFVPNRSRPAIRQLVSHWYEHRGEAATTATIAAASSRRSVPVPMVIQALLDPYRVATLQLFKSRRISHADRAIAQARYRAGGNQNT